jgi:N-acetylneuraminic acid mutarotase
VRKTRTVVLFGGSTAGGYSNDTWTFDGTSWTQVCVSNRPPARSALPLATLGNEVVLFGGASSTALSTGRNLNDTWTFDGTSWTQVSVSSSPPGDADMMATLGNEVVLLAGATGDTWTFDGTSWTQVPVSNHPSPRARAAIATLGNEVVLFGGDPSPWIQGTTPNPLGDTWTFDGTSWTQVSVSNSPPARAAAMMATLGNDVVLFGGGGGGRDLNDTWAFDGTSWTQVSVSNPPPVRAYAVMATLSHEVVLFGGYGSDIGALNDTWTFDGTSWTPVFASNSPPARGSTSMAALP